VKEVGVVVPTLGTRGEFLATCLQSLKDANVGHVCIVCPSHVDIKKFIEDGLVHQKVNDPGKGLAAAINAGVKSLPQSISIINWLGDDDYINPRSINGALSVLSANDRTVMVYGSCTYVDQNNKMVWQNRSGSFAAKILRFGPCLIPQPGALIMRDAFDKAGGLNERLGWAFDLDLFVKLSRLGKLKYVGLNLASFRWHSDSLTVSLRRNSVQEASRVRVSHLHPNIRFFSIIWEPVIRFVTYHSKKLVCTGNSKMQAE
jgi:GT2 family glycosyltransferase